jgi:hypothetical protein
VTRFQPPKDAARLLERKATRQEEQDQLIEPLRFVQLADETEAVFDLLEEVRDGELRRHAGPR